MDRSLQGIINTHQNLDAAGIGYTETWTEEEQSNSIVYQNVNGLNLAMISFTYGCNQPVDPSWAVNVYESAWSDASDRVIDQIKEARHNADGVIVCMHWGTEFTYELTEDQQLMAKAMAEAGADVIIGNHPHTIQPAEWIETTDGRRTLCFYSLGNLISSAYQVDRASEQFQNMYEVGAIAQFVLTKSGEHSIEIQDVKIIPVVNHFEGNYSYFRLMKLKDYTEELAQKHDQRSYSDAFSAQYLKDQVHSVFDPSGIALDLD